MHPRYLNLLKTGELLKRARSAFEAMRVCTLCPRNCRVDRLKGKVGLCRTSKAVSVASYNDHHGEEPPISGVSGSGTIFFSSCNMRCIFCQNYPISQLCSGQPATMHRLAEMMLELQKRGCHNINLVTPSHVVPQFITALYIAASRGLNIPIVYNSSGYDGLESLRFLDGIIDIYMPDIKYSSNSFAKEYSGIKNYVEHDRAALKEMHRQVGDLKMTDDGIALSGLIVRHLVLPENGSGTEDCMRFLADEISPNTYVSLMSQYFPAHGALAHPTIQRPITAEELKKAEDAFYASGLSNGWIQSL